MWKITLLRLVSKTHSLPHGGSSMLAAAATVRMHAGALTPINGCPRGAIYSTLVYTGTQAAMLHTTPVTTVTRLQKASLAYSVFSLTPIALPKWVTTMAMPVKWVFTMAPMVHKIAQVALHAGASTQAIHNRPVSWTHSTWCKPLKSAWSKTRQSSCKSLAQGQLLLQFWQEAPLMCSSSRLAPQPESSMQS